MAAVVTLTVIGAAFSLWGPVQGTHEAELERADLQQRMRVGVQALSRALAMAGAGPVTGPHAGTLARHLPPVVPGRRGLSSPDPPGTFVEDRVSLVSVPAHAVEAVTAHALSDRGSPVPLAGTVCGTRPRCGFDPAMRVALYDGTGSADIFTVTGVSTAYGTVALEHEGQPLAKRYEAGAQIVEVASVTYWFDVDAGTSGGALRRYDGFRSDLPLVDDVVAVRFEYFGDPYPPTVLRVGQGPRRTRTSYGLQPPAPEVDDPEDGWPAGENCLFMKRPTGQQVARPGIAVLGGADAPAVRLDESRLTDGPWCPEPTAPNRFDADLLRIRRVRVTLRLQVASPALRGRGALFARDGTGGWAVRPVPDRTVRFDVAPRNLGPGW